MTQSSDHQSVSDDAMSSVCSSDINNNDVFSESNSYTAEHQKNVARSTNPNMHILTRRRRNGKRWQNYKVTIYSTTNVPGALIVNAVTNTKYAYRVGTSGEDMFFSTILATGECKSNTPLLFYDNPEQYEAHLNVEVPMEIKRAWYVRYYALLADQERRDKTLLTLSGRKQDSTGTIIR